MVQKQAHVIPAIMESSIIERQGFEVYGEMQDNWTTAQIVDHFEQHYRIVTTNATDDYILENILDMFQEHELESMIMYHKIANVIECAKVAGYITELHGHYVVSIEFPSDITARK